MAHIDRTTLLTDFIAFKEIVVDLGAELEALVRVVLDRVDEDLWLLDAGAGYLRDGSLLDHLDKLTLERYRSAVRRVNHTRIVDKFVLLGKELPTADLVYFLLCLRAIPREPHIDSVA